MNNEINMKLLEYPQNLKLPDQMFIMAQETIYDCLGSRDPSYIFAIYILQAFVYRSQ